MKKIIIFLLAILIVPVVPAFSFDDLFDLELNDFVVGRNINNKDPSVTLSRPIDTQVVNNPVVFKWRYFDAENDLFSYFILQIDDDRNFFSPINYQVFEEEFKLFLDEERGDFFWRVQAVNKYGKSLSNSWRFFLNPELKVCEDGTAYFSCSRNMPFYCGSGDLKNDCQRCGCESNDICQVDGSCLRLTCSDGTAYGECSRNNPFLCLNGKLREVCNVCGCDEGECLGDGSCGEVMEELGIIIEPESPEVEKERFFDRIVSFFKKLFTGRG